MKNFLLWSVVFVYIFMMPFCYSFIKKAKMKNTNIWHKEDGIICAMATVVWPIFIPIMVIVDYDN